MTRLKTYLKSLRATLLPRRAPRSSFGIDRRLEDLEARQDQAWREIAAMKVDLGSETRRLNAVIDFYETRIDRIYARLSAGLAEQAHGAITVETDSDADDRIMAAFREGLGLGAPAEISSLSMTLTDRLTEGLIPSPLTLQGFRINRDRARELGDRIQIFAAAGEVKPGVALYGPYKDLAPGAWRLVATLSPAESSGRGRPKGRATIDVFSPTSSEVLAKASVEAAELKNAQTLVIPFEWTPDHALKGIEFRVNQRATVPFDLMAFRLERDAVSEV